MNQQVNLYHPIFRRQEKKFSAATLMQAGALVLAGVMLMYGYAQWRSMSLRVQLRDLEAQHSTALARLNDASAKLPIRHGDPRLVREAQELEGRIQAIQQIRAVATHDLFKGTAGYSDYLVALARQSMNGLWLTGLTISGAGESVVLSGRTYTPDLVPGYLQRLTNERTLAGLRFEIFQVARPIKTPGDPVLKTEPVFEPFVEFSVRSKAAEKPK